jgi:hypothetical protein
MKSYYAVFTANLHFSLGFSKKSPNFVQKFLLMKQTIFLFFIFFFTVQNLFAQSKLPLIRANAKLVTIVDGDMVAMTDWTLTPSAKPDVYTADKNKMDYVQNRY